MERERGDSLIHRDDMLELTRRMTPSRTCFDRVAGAYITDEGKIDIFHANPAREEKGLLYKFLGE